MLVSVQLVSRNVGRNAMEKVLSLKRNTVQQTKSYTGIDELRVYLQNNGFAAATKFVP